MTGEMIKGYMVLALAGVVTLGSGCCKIFTLGWSSGWVSGRQFVGRVRATPELAARASRKDGALDRDTCLEVCGGLDAIGQLRSCRYHKGPPAALRPYRRELACSCRYREEHGTTPDGVDLYKLPREFKPDRAFCRAACDAQTCGVPEPACRMKEFSVSPPAPEPGEEGIVCVYWEPGHCGNPRLSELSQGLPGSPWLSGRGPVPSG